MPDEAGEGIDGRLGVRSVGLQFEPGAAPGGERGQVEDTPAAHLTAVARDPDIGSELLGQSHEFVGGPEAPDGLERYSGLVRPSRVCGVGPRLSDSRRPVRARFRWALSSACWHRSVAGTRA